MEPRDKYFYPVTPATLHKYAESIFAPIRRHECVTTVWVPMSGRRMWNKFIIENIELFGKELPGYKKYILVYIEPLDLTEETLAGYIRLVGNTFIETCENNPKCKKCLELDNDILVFDDEDASYSKLLDAFRNFLIKITKHGFEVVFFLGEFDELEFASKVFYNNLQSLWSNLYPKVFYIFLTIQDLTKPKFIEKFGELNAATLQNVIYIPIRQGADIDYLIDYFVERAGCEFNDKQKKLTKRICGGHPYLIKATVRIIANNYINEKSDRKVEEALFEHYDLLSAARRLYNLRSDTEKKVLKQIVFGEKISNHQTFKRLIKLGLVKKDDKKYNTFSRLFNHTVKSSEELDLSKSSKNKKVGLYIDENGGVICYSGNPIEEKFTRQEYDLLKMFLENQGKLINRDDISKILWGSEYYEKYSDWAIDQVVSKVRKKIKDLGTKTKLITIRGRGYKLSD